MAGHLGNYNWWMLSLLLIVFIEQDLCVGLEKWLRLWVPLITFWKAMVEGELGLRMALLFHFLSYFVPSFKV